MASGRHTTHAGYGQWSTTVKLNPASLRSASRLLLVVMFDSFMMFSMYREGVT